MKKISRTICQVYLDSWEKRRYVIYIEEKELKMFLSKIGYGVNVIEKGI